jgi:pectate lyase
VIRASGVWLSLVGWLLASELVSACGDVWVQAIVPAPDEITGGTGGVGGNDPNGGDAAGGEAGSGGSIGPEGGAAGATGSGGIATVGGSSGAGGSAGSTGAAGGTPGTGGTAIGGNGGGSGNAGSSGSAGQPSCPLLQVGYSTVSGGTTGGPNGTGVKVSTAAELKAQLTKTDPMIVQIDSQITLTEQIRPKSDKTIIGVGKNAELTGGGLYILDVHNVIVQNLKISKATSEDAITIQSSQHVWVDHCDLSSDLSAPKDTYDDLVAVTHGSDYVTVSWTHFHDHDAVSLVGHSNDPMYAAEDMDHLTVTYHHNWFSNVNTNNPRVRYGKVHIFNNLFQAVAENAVISQMGAQVYVEGNVFQSVLVPITTQYQDPNEGGVAERDNSFSADSGANVITTPSSWMPSSAYSYNADSTSTVEFLVNACAGVGKL